MKVLQLLDTVNRGGAEMQVLDVCRNADQFGLEMTFVAAGNGALEEAFRLSGADFLRLDPKLPVDLYLASQLRHIIKERRIQIVHGFQAVEGVHLYLAAHSLKSVKTVLSFQGFVADRKNRMALRFLIPRMDANIVVRCSLQKALKEKDRLETDNNFHVIHNGADAKRLEPSGKSLRAEIGLDENTRLLGMIGNFYRDARKDQMTLCKALPTVFAEIPNAHCVCVGRIEEGAEEKAADCINCCIENKIIERVHCRGGRNDMPDILAALDLFVFSALREGLPIAVTEAMLAAVPMIVSDIEPLLEVSGNGKYAQVFAVGNAKMLSESIVKVLQNKALSSELARRAFEFAGEHFSIRAHLKKLKELYESII